MVWGLWAHMPVHRQQTDQVLQDSKFASLTVLLCSISVGMSPRGDTRLGLTEGLSSRPCSRLFPNFSSSRISELHADGVN
jgi:hypothetical protein